MQLLPSGIKCRSTNLDPHICFTFSNTCISTPGLFVCVQLSGCNCTVFMPQASPFCLQPKILAWRWSEMFPPKDAITTGPAISYWNTNIPNSFTVFYIYQKHGQADIGEFLETLQHDISEPWSPYISSCCKSLVILPGEAEAATTQPPFSSFSVPDLHSSAKIACGLALLVVIPCDCLPFPLDRVALNK